MSSVEIVFEDDVENEKIVYKTRAYKAGGSKTNYHGKKFEQKTDNENNLMSLGFCKESFKKSGTNKYSYYLKKEYEDKNIIFTKQNGLKTYMKEKYNIDIFRCPDESYIIEYKDGRKVLKILEKKEQRTEGSVETKLWSSPSLKREYELTTNFVVDYSLCVNNFLEKKIVSNNKKYIILNKILEESKIPILFGDKDDYFDKLNFWIYNEY